MKNNKGLDKSIIILILMVIVVVVTAFVIYQQIRIDKVTEMVQKGHLMKVMVVVEHEDKPLMTAVFFYHPGTNKGAILDIPSNTGSIIDSINRVDAIEVLYVKDDISVYKDKVEDLIGTQIPFHIVLKTDGVEQLVDILDGLELFIANPVEEIGDEKIILLPSGSALLDGGKVVDYMQYADPDEPDIELVGRKRKFLEGLLSRLGEKSDYIGLDEVYPYVGKAFQTNMEKRAILAFSKEMLLLDVERMIFQRTLGKKREMEDGKTLLFPHYDSRLLKETIAQIEDNLANSTIMSDEDLSLTLEVLNGTDQVRLAQRTANLFKTFGYEIAVIDNAETDTYTYTVVLDRRNSLARAKQVADVINCKRVHTEIDDSIDPSIDVTIILGKDFDGRYCK